MPAGRKQSNAMLYTVILFVAFSILGFALAIVFFLQASGYKNQADGLQSQLSDLATDAEIRKINTLVGDKMRQKSRIGTMAAYVDDTTKLILGKIDDTSAEIKVGNAKKKAKEVIAEISKANPGLNISDANSGLVPAIEKLNVKVVNASKEVQMAQQQYQDLQKRFDDSVQNSLEKEKALSEEKEKYLQQVMTIQKNYDSLKAVLEKSSGQQAKVLTAQLEAEKDNAKKMEQDVLKAQAELKLAQDKINRIQQNLNAVVPPPDAEVGAYKLDGRIVTVDEKTKTVFINLGSNDHVYQGLTFAVYDKSAPLPKDGKGKAEIEVYNVGKNVSTARITKLEAKKTILVDDAIANLIWDSKKTNVFVVAGDFDLDGDGQIDNNGVEKIKTIIERWGGRVDDSITVDTDFLVLGSDPHKNTKAAPVSDEKENEAASADTSSNKVAQYDEAVKYSKTLSVPVLNTERFLYFIGYKSQADRPGAF